MLTHGHVLVLFLPSPGTEEAIPVTTSGDLDEILYADTKRCPHLKVLMQASEAQLKGRGAQLTAYFRPVSQALAGKAAHAATAGPVMTCGSKPSNMRPLGVEQMGVCVGGGAYVDLRA